MCTRTRNGVVEYWEVRRQGVRCFVSWGREGGRRQARTMTLEDEEQARRHLERKIAEKLSMGYVEIVPEPPAPAGDR